MVSILLVLLNIIGIVLLVLLGLFLLILALPVGLRVVFQGGVLHLFARFGPVEFVLWPRPSPAKKAAALKAEADKGKGSQKPAAAEPPAPGRPVSVCDKQNAGDAAKPAVDKSVPGAGASPPSKPSQNATSPSPAASAGTASDEPEQNAIPLPGFLQRKVDALVRRARSSPVSLAKRLLSHFGWLGRRLLGSIRVTQLQVFWTVTAGDAAATAIRYGQTITVLNELLTLGRGFIKIKADSLLLEPDFTGERRRARRISCLIQTRPGTLLLLGVHLLFCIWNDKLLYEESASV